MATDELPTAVSCAPGVPGVPGVSGVPRNSLFLLEASEGIEPPYKDLQSSA
jgi:hypothetical protein